jgi:heavy metal translocating P-type ATPase
MSDRGDLVTRVVMWLTLIGLAGGGVAALIAAPAAAHAVWAATTVVALVPLTFGTVRALSAGNVGVDLIALIAMAGALALDQYLAGAVIALMLSGGNALEAFADARARRELASLVGRAPRLAHRYEGDALVTVDVGQVGVGDRLLVKPGEIVPVDGIVDGDTAVLDESALTGESIPRERGLLEEVRSGAVNAASAPFTLRARATAERSTYAGIVRLVEQAQASKAPLVRLADRYSMVFLPLTLGVAGAAWALSGDAVRALAVLVVATPCPLILAAPVAIVSGVSRAARHGVIVKGGGALETLARGTQLVLDKTGTVTTGTPSVTDVETFHMADPDEVLRLAASLDQASAHVIAQPIIRAARDRGLTLTFPTEVAENLGAGIEGRVEGRQVRLGKHDYALGPADRPAHVRAIRRRTLLEGATAVFVAVDGRPAGAIILEDPVRPDAPLTLRTLRQAGFERIIMLTGDHVDLAESVGAALGVDRVLAERSPEEKVEAVQSIRQDGVTVMVGDGINDAAALAAADVGVAMGARGATASSDAADIVLVVDRLDRLTDGIRIARRARAIAVQSILAGMGLSAAGMAFAAAGWLPPVAGALVQEVIDVAVILNALRALLDRGKSRRADPAAVERSRRFRREHRKMYDDVRRIRRVADRLDELPAPEARAELEAIHDFLKRELLPHNREEDATVYRVVADLIGGQDPTATMSRAHQEIAHLARLFGRLLEEAAPGHLDPDDLRELRRVLYGLHAVLMLHFAQEEESYLALIDERLETHLEK